MSLPPLPTSASNRLSTPPMSTSHSGLPPPVGMTMPQLTQGPLPMGQPPLSLPIGQLPPPQQWQGAEESMWSWLNARVEEYKQKQEEEKTRQELLRLEQRRIEQDMLWTALTGGIPLYMIPTVFAGMGGGNLPNASLELAQRSMAQEHHPQQQLLQHQQLLSVQAQASREQQRNESHLPSQHYIPQQHPMPVPPPRAVQNPGFRSDHQPLPASPSGQSHQPPGSPARSPPASHLPGPNTGEMHIHLPPPGHSAMQILPGQSSHPPHRSQTAQQRRQESLPSSISSYHSQPPTAPQAGRSGASQLATPSDHTSSSKKLEAQRSQQAALRPPRTHAHHSLISSNPDPPVSNTPPNKTSQHLRQ